jgi:hypothetical protein
MPGKNEVTTTPPSSETINAFADRMDEKPVEKKTGRLGFVAVKDSAWKVYNHLTAENIYKYSLGGAVGALICEWYSMFVNDDKEGALVAFGMGMGFMSIAAASLGVEYYKYKTQQDKKNG